MLRYNTIVQTSSIFKENTALGTRLRHPNEESSLVANKVNSLESGGNNRSYIHQAERKKFPKT